jgi:YD repeat-containing protein
MARKTATAKYDEFGRLVEISYTDGSHVTYNYDQNGNRQTVVEFPPSLDPPVPEIPTVAQLPKRQQGDLKNNQMLVLLSNKKIVGWGSNTIGVLANGVATSTTAIVQEVTFDPNSTLPPDDAEIIDWAMTNGALYIVFDNNWIYSAGIGSYGALGHGDTVARNQLKRIEYFVTNSIAIEKVWACGGYGTTNGSGCVYFQATNKRMYACGANAAGNLGNSTNPTTDQNTPVLCNGVPYTTNYVTDVAIACSGTYFSCYMLIDNNELLVAGFNGQGQLARGNASNVTGGFVNAKTGSSTNMTGVTAISANAGYSAANAGNALVVDSAGDVWTVGSGAKGVLGLGDTNDRNYFTQVTALSNIVTAELGGGFNGYGYAIDNSGTLKTWGYGNKNNLFQNSTTMSVTTPAQATYTPGAASKIFFPKGNNLSTNAQMIIQTTSGILAYCGESNGQIGIDNSVTPGAYKYIPTPRAIIDGRESITDVFVHGTSTTQRWFILTDLGNLYACGQNSNAICTGGVNSDSMQANTAWSKISFMP